MAAQIIFGGLLLTVSAFLMWRNRRPAEDGDAMRDLYLARRRRRRFAANLLIAMIGLAFIAAAWLNQLLAMVLLWGGVLLAVGCITILAIADMWSVRLHLFQLRNEHRQRRAALEADLIQWRKSQRRGDSSGNGRAPGDD